MRDLWSGTFGIPAVWADTGDALVRLAEPKPGMSVLDVGTGYGGTLFPTVRRIGPTGRIVGIDIDEECVDWTKKEIGRRGIGNAEVFLMNGHALDFGDAAFDVIVAGLVGLDEDYDFDAGEMIDGAPMLREAFRVLKPGNSIYLNSWLRQDDNEWMGELVRRRLPGCTKRGYFPGTAEGYVDLLTRVGFEDVHVERFEKTYTFNAPAEWRDAVAYDWEEELHEIRAHPGMEAAFERDAFALLATHTNDAGKIVYTRPTILVSARRPTGR